MLGFKTTEDILYTLDLGVLKSLCVFKKIKTRIRQRAKLIELLVGYYAATTIQRQFRHKLMKYNICPITHELLRYPFVSIRHPNGHFNYYSLCGIAQWFRKNKEYTCPNTRYQISTSKLMKIDDMYCFYYKKKLIKQPKETEIKNNDIVWVGKNLIDFVKNLENINYLSLNTIDQVVIPYIMNNLYFIFSKNIDYALVLLSLVINIISTANIENNTYITNQIKDML